MIQNLSSKDNVCHVNLQDHLNKLRKKLFIEIIRKLQCNNHLLKYYQEEYQEVKKLSYLVIMLILLSLENRSKLQVFIKIDIIYH